MITENDVRLIRQFLLAKEEDRTANAEKIWRYLTETRKLNLEVEKPNSGRRKHWGIPDSVDEVVILVAYGREPIWRIPASLKKREMGIFETLIEVPKELKDAVRI